VVKLLVRPPEFYGEITVTSLSSCFRHPRTLKVIHKAWTIPSIFSSKSNKSRSLPYPSGFLQETERTLALLFDPLGNDTSKRTRRIEKKHHVDLEAAIHSLIHSDARLDLRNYPFWQERLRGICRVYEDAQPKTLRQWWFDRRNRFNWATLWAAFIVFCLTLVFGVISSVTGIMQVYASFRVLQ
jgi:hypothetical protein